MLTGQAGEEQIPPVRLLDKPAKAFGTLGLPLSSIRADILLGTETPAPPDPQNPRLDVKGGNWCHESLTAKYCGYNKLRQNFRLSSPLRSSTPMTRSGRNGMLGWMIPCFARRSSASDKAKRDHSFSARPALANPLGASHGKAKEATISISKVPDAQLDRLAAMYNPKKTRVPATRCPGFSGCDAVRAGQGVLLVDVAAATERRRPRP
jgi:hypothetical protein